MIGRMPRVSICLVFAAVATGCAVAGPAGQANPCSAGAAPRPAAVKHVKAAMTGEPTSLVARFNSTQITIPGASTLEQLVNGTLTEVNGEGKLQPQLAEATPTLENGLWRVFADGRMETIWRVRSDARWHDGMLLTSEDFLFALAVDQDKEMPTLRHPWHPWIEAATAPDPQTLALAWNRPFIDADRVFTNRYVSPLPRHLLEETFLADKARFLNLPYWNQEYVGTGPFLVRQFTPGTSVLLQASGSYALGRPRIDEIEMRFIVNINTLMTNLLAGSVELTLGRGFAVEQALQLRDQWPDGRVAYRNRSWVVIHPQFTGPGTPMMTDLQFRRALMHGTDRQQLADSIQGGLSAVAHVYFPPTDAEYAEVEGAVVRYEYEPRHATQLIESLGYAKGPDGMFRSTSGERLTLELRSNGEPITEKTIIPVADLWTRLGVATEPNIVPPQRIVDREYVATFPSFRMMRQGNEAYQLNRLHSSQTPLPESRFVGSNYARYMSPAFDALIDRYFVTIPMAERMEALRQLMRHISEQLNLMGVFYDLGFVASSNRLQSITADETRLWNVHEWDVR